MTDETQSSDLLMGDLIGAPLAAASQANLQLATGMMEFIKAIGFVANRGEPAAGPDPANPVQFTGAPGLDPITPPVGPVPGDLGLGSRTRSEAED